jgi:hypothetical protein
MEQLLINASNRILGADLSLSSLKWTEIYVEVDKLIEVITYSYELGKKSSTNT